MKDTMKVTSKLKKLALWYDYTIVCDDMKPIIVHVKDDKFPGDMVQRQIELVRPVEYTKDELFKKYTGNEVVIKWEHTYTEQGEPAMAVVLETENN